MDKILIAEQDIQQRVKALAHEINVFLEAKKIKKVSVIWIAEGAVFFAKDLVEYLNANVEIEIFSIKISTYENAKKFWREPVLVGSIPDVESKDVLLIDDILDTGHTLTFAKNILVEQGAKNIFTCVFLNKKLECVKKINPDFFGFEIDDVFVYGYGLDKENTLRELRDLYSI